MLNGHVVVDVDAHYLEAVADLAEYMDEPWRTRVRSADAKRLLPQSLGDRMLGGRIRRDDVEYGYGGSMAPEQVPEVMQRLGVDASVMLPNRLTLLGSLSVRDLAVAFSDACIDFMLDKVVDPDRGVYTLVIVPWQDPEAGAATINRVGADPSVVGVCFMTSGAKPPLGDVRYNPVYEAAERFDLPIVFHADPALTLVEGASYADGLSRLVEAHSLGFLIGNQIQLTSLLMQGVPERYPKLKFVFLESGLFWLPMMMYRLDEYYLKRREEAPLLKQLPSEYVLDRVYVGTQPIEAPKQLRHLAAIFEMAHGETNFLYATDYPHFDYDDPTAILRLNFLDDDARAGVLGRNAMRVFNFRKGGVKAWESTLSEQPTRSPKEAASL